MPSTQRHRVYEKMIVRHGRAVLTPCRLIRSSTLLKKRPNKPVGLIASCFSLFDIPIYDARMGRFLTPHPVSTHQRCSTSAAKAARCGTTASHPWTFAGIRTCPSGLPWAGRWAAAGMPFPGRMLQPNLSSRCRRDMNRARLDLPTEQRAFQ